MFDGFHTPETYEQLGAALREARTQARVARSKLSELERAAGELEPANAALEAAESQLRTFLFEEAVAGEAQPQNAEERARLGAAVREARAAVAAAQTEYAKLDAARAEFSAAEAELAEAREAVLRARIADLGAAHLAANKIGTMAHAALSAIDVWAVNRGLMALAFQARREKDVFPLPTKDDPERLERAKKAWFSDCDAYGSTWAAFAEALAHDAEADVPAMPAEAVR